mgnify:FL=1
MSDATMDDLQEKIAGLSQGDKALVRDFLRFLAWRQEQAREEDAARRRPWQYSFLEHFDEASVSSSKDPAGMEVKVAIATAGGFARPALWQHPPVTGEALVTFHVPVPAGIRNLRLQFATGIRDGAQGEDQLIAFRIRVDGWQIWSRANWPNRWEPALVQLPFQAGSMLELAFATDGLGRHPWAWAVWAEPALIGELAA